MTQPARRFDLWRRLYTRFLIEPFPAAEGEAPSVATTIFPVTDADALLLVEGAQQFVVPAVDSVGQKVGITVPEGKRWVVHAISAIRASGDRNIDEFILRDDDAGLNMPIHLFTAASREVVILGTPLTLDENDRVDVNYVGGTNSTSFTVTLWASEGDAF